MDVGCADTLQHSDLNTILLRRWFTNVTSV